MMEMGCWACGEAGMGVKAPSKPVALTNQIAAERTMLRRLLSVACRWLQRGSQSLQGLLRDRLPGPELLPAAGPRSLGRLERVVLTEEVARTLFDDFLNHRRGDRGEEEIGWVLLGVRNEREVLVLATLPAGADRDSGVAHVLFNSEAQAIAARYVRQQDRRLAMVGVVHTHPGSLRHPSDGDYQGDSLWVGRLRGGEGVFGIGTADVVPGADPAETAPLPHRQVEGGLCFSWYALGAGDERYRKLPIETLPGPDLARPLHPLWPVIEQYAEPLDVLAQQLARVTFEALPEKPGPALAVRVPVAESEALLRVVLHPDRVEYYVERDGELTALDPQEPELDRAVYLILAELVREKQRSRSRGLASARR